MKKRFLYFFIALIVADSIYSFYQHFQMPLENDLVYGMLAPNAVIHIINDPLGTKALLENKTNVDVNRFFVPLFMQAYFKSVPFLLQKFMSPITSIYFSCALIKLFFQLFILLLLASIIPQNKDKLSFKKLILPATLIFPLFQTVGFNRQFGIIDQSITYTFFYALPLGLLFLYFYPFIQAFLNNRKIILSPTTKTLYGIFAFVLAFSGPLIPAIALIVCSIVLFYQWPAYFRRNSHKGIKRIYCSFTKISAEIRFIFIIISIFSLYSLYLAMANAEYYPYTISLFERYKRLPIGIFELFKGQIGLEVLIIFVIVNLVIIGKKLKNEFGRKILLFSNWVLFLSLIYILLLPLGGFRTCRPYIIRYDTFMPITISLFLLYGLSTYHIITSDTLKFKKKYIVALVCFLVFFLVSDFTKEKYNECEKGALYEISNSPDTIVKLKCNCSILSWGKITNFNDSKNQATLLQYWHVTKEKKLFYQE